jgi:sec-independent protein translocase protein TatC
VIAFVIAAVLTPPDVVSQFALATPLIIFYEIAIWIGMAIEKRRANGDKGEEPGTSIDKPAEDSSSS